MSRAGVAAVVLAGCLAASACTSATGSGSAASDSPAASASADPPTSALPSQSAPDPAPSTSPTSPVTSRPASSPTTKSVAPTHSAAATPTCLNSGLNVRVLQGGAVPGSEIALIIATNIGATTCTLTGFPTVTLFLKSRQLGQPSSPSGATVTTVTLKAGDKATSQITDHSSCQASLSDTARVSLPGVTGGAVDAPAQMRGCALTVAPMSGT